MYPDGGVMRKTSLIWLFCPLLLLGLLSGCSEQKTDEVMIQEQIDNLQEAIETHDTGRFMSVIDETYQDQLNNDRKALYRLLLGYFLRYKDISVFVSASQIEVTQIRAEVRSQLVVTGGRGLLPEDARHYQVISCWKKTEGEWLLNCLEWQ